MERERFTVQNFWGGSIFTIHDAQVAYLIIAECDTRSDAVMLAAHLNEIDPTVCSVQYASAEAEEQIERLSR